MWQSQAGEKVAHVAFPEASPVQGAVAEGRYGVIRQAGYQGSARHPAIMGLALPGDSGESLRPVSERFHVGQPPHRPTDEQRRIVETMAGYGQSHDDIARLIGVDDLTLKRRYKTELELGPIKARAKVLQNYFRMASSENNWFACRDWLNKYGRFDSDDLSKLGKKEIAMIEAQNAHEVDSEWAELVGPERIN